MAKSTKARDAVIVVLTLAVLIGLILGGAALFRSRAGADAAGQCVDTMGCKPNLHCVEKVCRPSCVSSTDCPSGLECTEFEDVKEKLGVEYRVSTFKACVAPSGPAKFKLPPMQVPTIPPLGQARDASAAGTNR